jgi:hypothetical protein
MAIASVLEASAHRPGQIPHIAQAGSIALRRCKEPFTRNTLDAPDGAYLYSRCAQPQRPGRCPLVGSYGSGKPRRLFKKQTI